MQGSQAGLAACDAAAGQCSHCGNSSLTVGQHLHCCQHQKLCLYLGQPQRQHLVHRNCEEGGATFTTQRWILRSVSFQAQVLRAEGHHSCSSFCQRCSLCFFLSFVSGRFSSPHHGPLSPSLSHCHLKGWHLFKTT